MAFGNLRSRRDPSPTVYNPATYVDDNGITQYVEPDPVPVQDIYAPENQWQPYDPYQEAYAYVNPPPVVITEPAPEPEPTTDHTSQVTRHTDRLLPLSLLALAAYFVFRRR